jgi:hypothetical protein
MRGVVLQLARNRHPLRAVGGGLGGLLECLLGGSSEFGGGFAFVGGEEGVVALP